MRQPSFWTYLIVFVAGCALAAAGLGLHTALSGPSDAGPAEEAAAKEALPVVTVYKSPTCGCCTARAEHMETAGFPVEAKDLADVTPNKDALGVPAGMRSCHTSTVGGYAIEGHVPAADVKRLLAEQPDVAGLAMPGMPVGSPGMKIEGQAPQPYSVLAFAAGRWVLMRSTDGAVVCPGLAAFCTTRSACHLQRNRFFS